ncbi:MAG: sugar transferase [Clostridia bacterium]|nr:sugar transferase [Clostridia bacterium]
MSISGVNKYSFAEVNTVDKLSPADTTINKRTLKQQIEKIIKRIIDVCGGLVGVITLIPLTIIIYIANIIAKDKGPVFYSQQRIGKDGKIFKMYKYRSMIVGADKILERYLEENENAKKEYKEYKKLKNDPRVTKIGNFIRKTSLDEFPQFINVLKGDMSLVGPRPYLPREKEDMGKYYTYIIESKPGITGFWQIAGRSDVTFEDRLKMDYNYNQNKSLKTDMKLLIKTVINVAKKEGAI